MVATAVERRAKARRLHIRDGGLRLDLCRCYRHRVEPAWIFSRNRFVRSLAARYNMQRSGTSKQVRGRKLFEPMMNL
jgi:hypothetical protein